MCVCEFGLAYFCHSYFRFFMLNLLRQNYQCCTTLEHSKVFTSTSTFSQSTCENMHIVKFTLFLRFIGTCIG